jgi:nucleotide-binding universal stress UspA family protein
MTSLRHTRTKEHLTEAHMRDELPTPNDPILLATAGLADSDAAVRAAADFAAAGRPVKVIAVLEPPPLVAGEYGFVVPVESIWEDRRDELLARVRKQLTDITGSEKRWPIEVRTGDPATTIADAAQACDAALIVMGLGEHQLIDRALGTETALHTVRVARTPVFAVPQTYGSLPTRAVVGADFSDASVAALRFAFVLLPTLTRVSLVHIAPRWDMQPTAYIRWQEEYERGMVPALERMIKQLEVPPTVTVTNVIREGKTAKELLKTADESGADVIVVGSRGLGFLDRVLVGSTASGIIRGAQVAVFTLPLAAVPVQAQRPLELAAVAT